MNLREKAKLLVNEFILDVDGDIHPENLIDLYEDIVRLSEEHAAKELNEFMVNEVNLNE